MDKDIQNKIVSLYGEHKNLKVVGKMLDIPWQTVYWHLNKLGVKCIGDKEKYGCEKDRFACKGESYIQNLFGKKAQNMNEKKFQNKFDFIISGLRVDVKSSKLSMKNNRWPFSLKKQRKVADFYILLCYDAEGSNVLHHLLIPNFMVRDSMQTLSVSRNIESCKCNDFSVSPEQLIKAF